MAPFKVCKKCGKVWNTMDDFFSLDGLIPLGFQAHFTDGMRSVLLFQHDEKFCQTTLAIQVIDIIDLIPGFVGLEDGIFMEGCRGLCLTDNRLDPCDNPFCRNAVVREFVQKLLDLKSKTEVGNLPKE